MINSALKCFKAIVGLTVYVQEPQESTPLSVPTEAEKTIGVSYVPIHKTSVPKGTAFAVVTLNVAV